MTVAEERRVAGRQRGSGKLNGQRWWNPVLAVPALIATFPLTGFALQNEERRAVVRAAREFGSNPLAAAGFAIDTVGPFLRAGNFRPLGRFVEKAEYAFAFEAAEATGLSLHTVQGALRLALVAALAMTAAHMVATVMRSAGYDQRSPSMLLLYSIILGAHLVASHHLSSLSAFPMLLLGSPLLILAVALVVARDRDMRLRRMRWHEYARMALLGAVAAMLFDLVYLAPAVAAGFILARAVASGQDARSLLETAAVRRWAAVSAGFLAVFVPVRVLISGHCARQACSEASDVVWSADIFERAAQRLLTGAPPAGWAHTSRWVGPYGYRAGLLDLAGNWLLLVLLAAAAVLCARSARTLLPGRSAPTSESAALGRAAVALALLGVLTALLAASLVSLSRRVQEQPFAVGEVWRDSPVVQIGWSFMIFAAVMAALAFARGRGGRFISVVVLSVALAGIGMAGTLLTNFRLGHIGRGTPTTMLVRQLSTTVVSVDSTQAGNIRRCGVLDAYVELYPNPGWWQGQEMRAEFNHFMLDRYGVLFCDGPGQEPELISDPPSDWDWRPW